MLSPLGSFPIFLAQIVKMIFWDFPSVSSYQNGSTSWEEEEMEEKTQTGQSARTAWQFSIRCTSRASELTKVGVGMRGLEWW